jgi:hypothetical protein
MDVRLGPRDQVDQKRLIADDSHLGTSTSNCICGGVNRVDQIKMAVDQVKRRHKRTW